MSDVLESVAGGARPVPGRPAPPALYAELFDQAPGFMAVTMGPDHLIVQANKAFQRLVGRGALVGRRADKALRRLVFAELCDRVYSTAEPFGARAAPLSATGPSDAFVTFAIQPIIAPDGQVEGLFFQGYEVTDEKRGQDELEAQRHAAEEALAALTTIFDCSQDVICSLDCRGVFLRVSRHAEIAWGYAPDELVGRRYLDFVHRDDREATLAMAAELKAGRATSSFRNRFIRKDGEARPMMWSAAWSDVHRSAFGIARDMRDHVQAEQNRLQAQKMEALGRLTGGVAHDFNNLLTAVVGSAEALSDALGDRPDLRALADAALNAAEKGGDLVRRLLAFARQQPLSARSVDCTDLVRSVAAMLGRVLGSDIEIRVEASHEQLCCLVDPVELTSALLNLAFNARDAMPTGGALTFSVARGHHDKTGEPRVMLAVGDTGHGMAPEVVSKAVEPFFTTRAEAGGTGLGLSTVFGFVTDSGGELEIDSAPGAGTTVRMCFPETDQKSIEAGPLTAPETSPARIMIVEDDGLVREQVERQLLSLGHQVTSFARADEALRALGADDGFDLLMTDMVMPGMGGRDLAARARRAHPGLKVLFTSGYSQDSTLASRKLGRSASFLPKPYRRAELAKKIAELLPHV